MDTVPGNPNPIKKDHSTILAEERTSLAAKRNFYAAERTLMAWIRTALSMISFGFTMIKFFQYLGETRGPITGPMGRVWTPDAIGFSLMAIGTASLIVAVYVHRKEMKALHAEGAAPNWSLAFLVGSLVACLGVFAFVSLIVEL